MARRYVRSVHPATMRRVRLEVFTRDNFTCVTCGWRPSTIPLDYDGTRTIGEDITKPNGKPGCRLLELDHVTPHSLGGRFASTNLQTLCNSCNARKGARV